MNTFLLLSWVALIGVSYWGGIDYPEKNKLILAYTNLETE